MSELVTFGTAMVAEDPVIHTLEVVIHPRWVSAKRHAAAIFSLVITCPSGVTGAVVTGQWWWLEEEVIHARERIMGLVLQRLMTLILTTAVQTLVMTATILLVILSIFGFNNFVQFNDWLKTLKYIKAKNHRLTKQAESLKGKIISNDCHLKSVKT